MENNKDIKVVYIDTSLTFDKLVSILKRIFRDNNRERDTKNIKLDKDIPKITYDMETGKWDIENKRDLEDNNKKKKLNKKKENIKV